MYSSLGALYEFMVRKMKHTFAVINNVSEKRVIVCPALQRCSIAKLTREKSSSTIQEI